MMRNVYGFGSYPRFKQSLTHESLSNDRRCLPGISLDDNMLFLCLEMFKIYDRCCPIRIKQVSENRTNKPWINKHVLSLVRYKHFLFKQFKNKIIPLDIYKNFKINVAKYIDDARKNYLIRKFDSCGNDLKKTWNGINDLFRNSSKKKNLNTISLEKDGSLVNSSLEVSNEFNNYFSSVAIDLDRNIPIATISPMHFLSNPIRNSIFINPTFPNEVENLINNAPLKSCPLNEIPTFIFKQIKAPLSAVISTLFNESVETANFPRCLKIARIVPVYKEGDNTSVKNYRPISVLPFIGKMFAKLMYARLNKFFTANDVIFKHQFGFQTGLGTSDAIVEFLDHVYKSIGNHEIFVSVYIDLRKAFDTVNGKILLNKLNHYGVRGVANDWIKSYLTNRQQFVSIEGSNSPKSDVCLGVPQGSVLGPLLFLVYVNDMFSSCPNMQLIHYADDTTAFCSAKTTGELITTVNSNLKLLNLWLQSNRLSLNVQKSSYMIFGNHDLPPGYDFVINSQPLTRSETAKFLGIQIDSKLNFKCQTEKLLSKISRVAGITWKARLLLAKSTLRKIYLSLAYSHLMYGILAWGQCS